MIMIFMGSLTISISILREKFTNQLFCRAWLHSGDFVSPHITRLKNNTVVTFSEYRNKQIIKKYPEVEVLKIGPYINYCKSLLNDSQLLGFRKMFGKSLLYFPHHIPGLAVNSDHAKVIQRIEDISSEHEIDTKIVSLYWLDTHNNDLVDLYQNHGFKIFCAGHKHDLFFLNRLRSVIEISALTISNSYGTHVPYCLSMQRPHMIISDDSVFTDEYKNNEVKFEKYSKKQYINRLNIIHKIEKIFDSFISLDDMNENFSFLDYHFGFSEIKTKRIRKIHQITMNIIVVIPVYLGVNAEE